MVVLPKHLLPRKLGGTGDGDSDDFEEELLLPHKNSTYGPSIATGDLNGDSKTDYIIGGAVGQPATLFNRKRGIT